MTNLNWKEIKPGAKVKFRCGGEAVIESIYPMYLEDRALTLKFVGMGQASFYPDGTGWATPKKSPFDIVEIIPAPEPKREIVEMTLTKTRYESRWIAGPGKTNSDTHRITFTTIDGKPDCRSIKMEELS